MTGTAAFDAVGRALVQRCAGDLPAVLAPVLDPLGTVGPLDHAAQFRWQHLQGQRPASRTPQRHVVRLHAKVPVVPRPALGVRVLEVPPLLSRRPTLRKRAPLRPPRLHHPPQDEPRRCLARRARRTPLRQFRRDARLPRPQHLPPNLQHPLRVRLRPLPPGVALRTAAARNQAFHALLAQSPLALVVRAPPHPRRRQRLRQREPPPDRVDGLQLHQPPQRLRVVRLVHPHLPVERRVLCEHPRCSVSHVVHQHAAYEPSRKC